LHRKLEQIGEVNLVSFYATENVNSSQRTNVLVTSYLCTSQLCGASGT
jgi:hypothetical protein